MDPTMQGAVALTLAVAAVPMAAKAHGRQVRLRREAEGVHAVDFRGTNPPVVEALWRRDRVGYWSVAVAAAAGWLALGVAGVYRPDPAWAGWPVAGAATLVLAFLAMGAYWWSELRRVHAMGATATPTPQSREPPGWPWAVGAALMLAGAFWLTLA